MPYSLYHLKTDLQSECVRLFLIEIIEIIERATLLCNEFIERLAECLAFKFLNSLIHYTNSVDEENGIVIIQWYRIFVIEKSHEEHHTVGLVQLSCNILMGIEICFQFIRKVIVGKAKKEFIAKHGMIVAIHKVLLCHLVEDSTHAPLGCFESGNNAIQLTGERVTALPVFLAFISQVMLNLMPAFREHSTYLNLKSIIEIWCIFLRQGCLEIFQILLRNLFYEIETLRTESRDVKVIYRAIHEVAVAKEHLHSLHILREIQHNPQAYHILYLGSCTILVSLDLHLMLKRANTLCPAKDTEHDTALGHSP